jgi:hypothetical protein
MTSSEATPPARHGDRAVDIPAPVRGGPLSGVLGGAVVIVLLVLAGYFTWQAFTTAEPLPPRPMTVDVICAETGKHYVHDLQEGERYPVYSPFTKGRTGYRAEKCYWTREGKAKLEPTFVLLDEYVGKPGPTLCPDCGRLVEPHNPMPPGDKMEAARRAAESAKGGGP